MVVEVGVGDGDPLRSVSNIKETIVVVLAVVKVRRQIKVVNPDVAGGLNTNSITVVGEDLAALEVAEDDILNLVDVEADTLERGFRVQTNNGSVRGDTDFLAARDCAKDVDNSGIICSGSLSELGQSRDGGGGTAFTTGSTAIGRGVTDGAIGGACCFGVAAGARAGAGSDGSGTSTGCCRASPTNTGLDSLLVAHLRKARKGCKRCSESHGVDRRQGDGR